MLTQTQLKTVKTVEIEPESAVPPDMRCVESRNPCAAASSLKLLKPATPLGNIFGLTLSIDE